MWIKEHLGTSLVLQWLRVWTSNTRDMGLIPAQGSKACFVCVCIQSYPTLCDSVDCEAQQAPLSLEFSRKEYWSGLPFPSPEIFPNPGIEPTSLMSPALAGRFFTISATWEDTLWSKNNKPKHLGARLGRKGGRCTESSPLRISR